ncbi:MAG: DNA polymerase III subunit gamma/tau [Lachnospiraceae bacterium]|nr:DNA polymerase III subunit gamma/tau [Lachnospiraceae bacterium]
MSYVALYRKFRPDGFEDVKGQEHIVTTLRNQIESDRIGHAYLFCGTRGTGKTTVAKIFARAVNCEHPAGGSPCGECATCKAIAAGVSMNVIEIDAASNNGVDNIREIVDEVAYSPTEGRFKVYIIDEVHMLSIGAFNALLKTLEEPPSYVIFILATTEAHKIPITILSRCQRYDFRRISIDTIAGRLKDIMEKEQVDVEEKALRYVAKAADGSMRDALSLLDQCIAFHFGDELTYDKVLDVLGAVDTGVFSRLLRCVLDRNVSECIALLDEIVIQGRELTQFVTDFTWYLRNLLLVKTSDHIEDVIDMSTENLHLLQEEAERVETDGIIRYIRIFSELSGQLKYAAQKRVLTEVALIKLCRPQMETKQDALLDRIRALEQRLESGDFAPAGNAAGAYPGAPGGQGGLGIDGAAGSGAGAAPRVKQELPKALPEDVKRAVSNWQSIAGRAEQPMRLYLQNARLSLGGDDQLVIVLPDGIMSDYFTQEKEHHQQLEALISGFLGKQTEVTVQVLKENVRFTDHYVDLASLINMEIEEEDEPESDIFG